METKEAQLIKFIKTNNGFAKYAELVKAGFYKSIIRSAVATGKIKRISRGIYKLVDFPDISSPDLVTAGVMFPKGVICLITALSFHDATDEIPRFIDIAVPANSRTKKTQDLPVRFYYFASEAWSNGIEEHIVDGQKIRVYCLAKTIADCFKFRNKIGMDTARSALKFAIENRKANPNEIMKYARICHVSNIIKPILESIL
jgi:predicted transcriptional regulator of viral defense system